MSYQESTLWRRTLAPQVDDPHLEAREVLRTAFADFRKHVEPLGKEVALSVPGYTDHSIDHCDSLWGIADLIVGPEFEITPAEAFVLGGAFLIHDLAMGLAAYSGGLREILESDGWRDLLWGDWGADADALQAQAMRDVELDPTWNGLTSTEVKRTLTTFLREHHAEEAEDLLKTEWVLTSGEKFYLLPNVELRQVYGEAIGQVARSHWLDVAELENNLLQKFGAPPSMPGEWSVDPLKVACILRLADAAQVDSRRASPLHTPFRRPQNESLDHWMFQERMLVPHEDGQRLVFTSGRAFRADDAEAWWLAFDTVAMINSELQAVDSLCADLGRERMQCRSAAGSDSPERFANYVPTSGWQPLDARPRIRNPIHVIESLGGRALYGDDDDVPLRELLANANDAALARKAVQGPDANVPATQVRFKRDGDDYFLSVRDFGIGMSSDDIATYLCDFGTSGWRSRDFRNSYPGALASGYTSTGRFGVGFYSVFMIADDVRVTSRPLQGGWSDTHCLEFRNGISERPVMRRAAKREQLHEPGTEVLLKLKRNPCERGGLLHGETMFTPENQVDYVRSLAFTTKHPLDVWPLGGAQWVNAFEPGEWFERDRREIYAAAAWGRYKNSDDHRTSAGADRFVDLAGPIRDGDGNTIGVVSHQVHDGLSPMAIAAGYCGGFIATSFSQMSGVLEGETVRASRDQLDVAVTLESMRDWLRDQRGRLNSLNASPVDMMRFQTFATGFGISFSDDPIAIGESGLVTPREIESWLTTKDSFSLVDISSPRIVEIPDRGIWVNAFEDLISLAPGSLGVLYGQRDREDGLPPNDYTDPYFDEIVGADVLSDELFARGVWWFVQHSAPAGQIAQIACSVWGCELKELIDASEAIDAVVDANPTHPTAVTYSGAQVGVTGRKFVKPDSASMTTAAPRGEGAGQTAAD